MLTPLLLAAGFLVGTAWLVLAKLRWPFDRFEVADESMVPTLLPGDRLLVLRPGLGGPITRGDVVVVRDPERQVDFLVKRVVRSVEGPHVPLTVFGDNPAASRDSRQFGSVPSHLLVGRVTWRYWPPERRGSLPTPSR